MDRASVTESRDQLRYRAKAALRRQMATVRNAIPKAAREARSTAIAMQTQTLSDVLGCRVCLVYAPFRSEVDVSLMVDWLHAEGKAVAWPRVDVANNRIAIHRWDEPLVPNGTYGIAEPPATAELVPDADVDLVLVPALAVDPRGYRIGYGKGYYDRLLPRLRQARRLTLAFDFQLIAEAPNTPGDEPVHKIVTDRQVIECPAAL